MSQSSSKASWLRIPVSSTSSPATANKLLLSLPEIPLWKPFKSQSYTELKRSLSLCVFGSTWISWCLELVLSWSWISWPWSKITFLHWRFAESKTAWSLSFDISKSYIILIIYLFPHFSPSLLKSMLTLVRRPNPASVDSSAQVCVQLF